MNTPQLCLEAFFQALESKDPERVRACVLDPKPDPRVDELLSQFPSVRPNRLQVQTSGDTADATFHLDDNRTEPWHCRMKRSGDDWFLFLERSADELIADSVYAPDRSLDPLLAWLVYPDRFEELMSAARADAEHKACVSNVRLLTHRLWNLTASGREEVTVINWREAIRFLPKHPHDRDWFSCPVTGDPYSLNVEALTTRNPHIPLVYEGKDRKLSFNHGGKAVVGFCDGSARLVGPDEELSWS
jgi:prepilin-type processing-associated H-X9-DG protein